MVYTVCAGAMTIPFRSETVSAPAPGGGITPPVGRPDQRRPHLTGSHGAPTTSQVEERASRVHGEAGLAGCSCLPDLHATSSTSGICDGPDRIFGPPIITGTRCDHPVASTLG